MGLAVAAALSAAPLSVVAPASVRGDGRTPAAVEIAGGPDPLEGEDESLPDRGSITCDAAASLPATDASPARLIPRASDLPRELACVARRRGEEKPFSLRAEPPAPGLYATLVPAADAGTIALLPFRIDSKGGSATPGALRATASAGAIERADDGGLRLVLPPGRAPRALAVALLDEAGPGAAFLPLPGSTQLNLESKRHATLAVRIAGAIFGPVQAPDGKAQIRVVVPPGVRSGVVRAVDRLGNVRELLTDLDTPDLPRIAAVASAEQVVAEGDLRIAVALADASGAPAEQAELRFSAGRGEVGATTAAGPGLFTATYRAPAAPGQDRIQIDLPSDLAAGSVQLAVEIVPGPPAVVALQLPVDAVRAGEPVRVEARVRDAAGNALPQAPLEATLEGVPARVVWEGEVASIFAGAPEHVPAGGSAQLSVRSSGAAQVVARIDVRPTEAVTAELTALPAPRSARLRALVRDRFGNLLGASGFALSAKGASVGPLQPLQGGGAEATLEAGPRAREAEAELVSAGRILARARIAFDPPPEAWLVTARSTAAAMTNGGVLHGLRLGLGLGLRRRFGPFEGGVLAGVDGLAYRDQVAFAAPGSTGLVSRRLFVLPVPLLGRVRLPFAGRWGAALEAGAVPTFAWTSSTGDLTGVERFRGLVLGARAGVSLDFVIGRGRLLLGATAGTAQLRNGPIRGDVEGRSLYLGYEAWWLDISR